MGILKHQYSEELKKTEGNEELRSLRGIVAKLITEISMLNTYVNAQIGRINELEDKMNILFKTEKEMVEILQKLQRLLKD